MVKDIGLHVGTIAPEFGLPKETNEIVHLSSLLGGKPIMLAFYCSDFGVMCSVEIKAFKDYYARFERVCILLPISTNTTYSHGAWSTALDLPFPLLSDMDGKVSKAYDVMPDPDDISYGYLEGGRSYRAVFLLDRKGVIRYRWAPEDPSLEPDYEEILAFLEMLGNEP